MYARWQLNPNTMNTIYNIILTLSAIIVIPIILIILYIQFILFKYWLLRKITFLVSGSQLIFNKNKAIRNIGWSFLRLFLWESN